RKPGGRWGGRLVPPIVQKLTWASFIHVVVSGLATGSIYALMALALVIIYNATRTLNFAQGEMLMVSTFIGWTAQRALGWPLAALFRWPRLGRAMRAVAQNQRAARLMGISVERVYATSWVLAAVVGAVAGVLVAPVVFLSSKMGLIVINGFTAAVVGGFGSMPGAVAGGMLLGVIENLAPLYLPSGIRYSVPFLVLIAILVVRPAGLLGRG